jgi:hypothetical protein
MFWATSGVADTEIVLRALQKAPLIVLAAGETERSKPVEVSIRTPKS